MALVKAENMPAATPLEACLTTNIERLCELGQRGGRFVARSAFQRLRRVAGAERTDRLRIAIDDMQRRIRGTPWLYRDHFEVTQGTWGGVLRIHDETGRLLGENHGLPRGVHTHPTIAMQASNFVGSRRSKPYNESALRHMARDWRAVRSLIATVRHAYFVDLGDDPRPLSILETMTLGRIVTAYPAFLLRAQPGAVDDHQIPKTVASAFKVMAGVHASIEHLIEHKATAEANLRAYISPDWLYDYIEDESLFVSAEGRACGGPERLIRETLHSVIDGPQQPSSLCQEQRTKHIALVRYGRLSTAIELLLIAAADIQRAALRFEPAPQLNEHAHLRGQIAAAVAELARTPALDTVLAPIADDDPVAARQALVEALDRLSRLAAQHLGRPAPVSKVDWSTLELRLRQRSAM